MLLTMGEGCLGWVLCFKGGRDGWAKGWVDGWSEEWVDGWVGLRVGFKGWFH